MKTGGLSHVVSQLPAIATLLYAIIATAAIFYFLRGFYFLLLSNEYDQKGQGKKMRSFVVGLLLSSFAVIIHVISQSIFQEASSPREDMLSYVRSANQSDQWQDVVYNSALAIISVIGIWTGFRALTKMSKSKSERPQGETDTRLLMSLIFSTLLINARLLILAIQKTINWQ